MCFVSERFEMKVKFAGADECWEWQATRTKDGYGRFHIPGTRASKNAHRVVFEWFHGRPIAPGMEIMHLCDNPPCVNPAHLKEGTHRENMLDSHAKGRSTTVIQTLETLAKQRANTPRGERHHMKQLEHRLKHSGDNNGNRKMNQEEVDELRRLREEEYLTLEELGERFGISHVLAGMIVRGDVWDEGGYLRRQRKQPRTPYQAPVRTMPQKGHWGEASGTNKLTWEKVREIRRIRKEQGLTQSAIAALFGVSQVTIGEILRQKTWREV